MTARPAIVGGFILGSLGLAVIAILLFGGSHLFKQASHAVVFFEGSVAGLDVGAPVTFRGVKVGSVERIALDFSTKSMTARIPVFLALEPDRVTWNEGKMHGTKGDYEKLVAAGLRAQLASQSFVTGQLRVDLDFHPGTPAQLGKDETELPEIPAMISDIDQLEKELKDLPVHELAQTALHTLSTIDQLATHLNDKVDPLLDSVRRASDTATLTLQTTNIAVQKLQANTATTLANVNSLTFDAQRQLDARGDELSLTLATTDRTAIQAELLLSSLNGLTEPHSQLRDDMEAAVRDLAASASSLRTFSHEIERNPSAFLTGRTMP